MTRVLLVGYQGMGNLGDEAILAGIQRLVAGTSLEVAAVADGGQAAIPAFPGVTRVPTPRFFPGRDFRRALRSADALLVSGGGLINDHWPTLIPRYLTWTVVARLMGRRVGWLAVGVGPLRGAWSRWLAGLMLRLASLVSTRDAASARLVEQLPGGRTPSVMPDPSFFLPAPAARAPSRGLAVVVRGTVHGRDDQAVADTLAELLSDPSLHRADRPATLVAMHATADEPMLTRVADAVTARGNPSPTRLVLPLEPAAALDALADFEAVVSVRLHGLLLATLAGRPAVGIGYDPKVAALAEELGAPELALNLTELSAATLRARLDAARQAEVMARVSGAVSALANRRASVAVWLEEAMR